MTSAAIIVIPCLNEAASLPGLLRQMLDDTRDMPIVVADGGSTDGSVELVGRIAAAEPRVRLLHNPARIQAAGINLAVREHGADATWLIRVDAHCDYPPRYVERLLAVAAERDATSVVVPMVSRGRTCFQVAAATAQNSRLGTGGSAHRHIGTGRYIEHGHHALMDLALFWRVGGYRDDMSHNEDAELDHRLLGAGGRIWLEPDLALFYYPRSSASALWRQYRNYGAGRARTLRLHGMRPKLRQMLPLAVVGGLVLALAAPLHPLFALPLLLWATACIVGGLLIGRRGGGCAMASGAAAMIMHLAWAVGFLESILRRH